MTYWNYLPTEKRETTSIANESEMRKVWYDAYTERLLEHRATKQGSSSVSPSERDIYRRINEIEVQIFMIVSVICIN